ncbi:F-box/kelch-repeat protein At3g06240-like isoform X2 [Lotus japonicus]|uniref:F-box/kelch-repeat protein At3g06240-like isoform X2 n=1 Tax=Lotus japonicus TaxID=34305 RepID=UPI00258E0E0E|nr:F-box/kelch-repeat protein At3g06240-like isoform X2 [Lotus japonicus]
MTPRGFLLVRYEYRYLLVWNPSTGVRKLISYPHAKFKYDSLYGFWYDASTDDYLVLLMVAPEFRPDLADWRTDIVIFSLKTNSWDEIEDFKFPYQTSHPRTEAGLLLNGALHWLVYSRVTYNFVIIAFDLIQRSVLEIPLPYINIQSAFQYRIFYLRVMGDCLCLCNPGSSNRAVAEIWMMKEYKVDSSWTKSFVLPTNDIPLDSFLPICFTKSEGLFGSNCNGRLVKFNSEGVLSEHCTWRENSIFRESLLQSAIYRESLLSLPGEFGELSEHGQQERQDVSPVCVWLGRAAGVSYYVQYYGSIYLQKC